MSTSRVKNVPVSKPPIPAQIKVIIVAAFVIALGFGIIAPILPQFASSFDVGPAAAAAIVSIFALFRLLFAPVSGRLTERWGEPATYVVGVSIVAISTILCGFAASYGHLMVFRAFGGIGSTMFTVSAMALISRLSPEEIRGRIAGLYSATFLIGNIAGPVLGAALAGFGYRLAFFIYGGALIIAAATVFVFLQGVGKRRVKRTADTRPVMKLEEAWAVPAFRASVVAGFAHGWNNFGVRVAIVPLFAATAFIHGDAIAGFALAIFAAGNALALTVSGKLSDTYGRKLPIMWGLSVGALAMIAMGYVTNEVVFIVLCAIAGVGTGIMNPSLMASVADTVGNGRNGGRVMATFQMSQDLGAIIGPVLVGAIAEYSNYSWGFLITGILALIGAAAWTPVRRISLATKAEAPAKD
ncbi:arabinose ABC transporter permease [Neomicrococcus aestuarii]|uniref:Arabinose ABC transporter permease n=1 Tax=Neomicrococcus aestuarii TaxID=556325 RepID=A0A1L2ZKP9_9MICC|nr:arabinose ABC transporter permease [Neomicrococcus aestuarii]